MATILELIFISMLFVTYLFFLKKKIVYYFNIACFVLLFNSFCIASVQFNEEAKIIDNEIISLYNMIKKENGENNENIASIIGLLNKRDEFS
jgi:hypothetical protein